MNYALVFDGCHVVSLLELKRMLMQCMPAHVTGHEHGVHRASTSSMLCMLQIDMAPMAVRRSAMLAIGGMDESMSEPGECGIIADWCATLHSLWSNKCLTHMLTTYGMPLGAAACMLGCS